MQLDDFLVLKLIAAITDSNGKTTGTTTSILCALFSFSSSFEKQSISSVSVLWGRDKNFRRLITLREKIAIFLNMLNLFLYDGFLQKFNDLW